MAGIFTTQKPAYTLMLSHGSLSPTDGTTYYFGAYSSISAATTDGNMRVYIPCAGTITAAYGTFRLQSGVLGTNENVTLNVRINSTTSTLISNSVQINANTGQYSNTALSIAVSAGDFVEIQMVCPTWVTNPTNLLQNVVLYIN